MATTAFGRAMLESVNGRSQQFRMSIVNGGSFYMSCQDFLTTRPEEDTLLNNIELPREGAVLDVGCGIGRHLAKVRQRCPQVHCWGVEKCDLMLEHCRATIAAPATFVRSLDEVPSCKFDLIMLMGNGLGVLGNEQDATASLRALVARLAPSGRIVIETGIPFGPGRGYVAPQVTITYGGDQDGPFTWGCSDRDWITRTLEALGCHVRIQNSNAPGGCFFAIGQRPE